MNSICFILLSIMCTTQAMLELEWTLFNVDPILVHNLECGLNIKPKEIKPLSNMAIDQQYKLFQTYMQSDQLPVLATAQLIGKGLTLTPVEGNSSHIHRRLKRNINNINRALQLKFNNDEKEYSTYITEFTKKAFDIASLNNSKLCQQFHAAPTITDKLLILNVEQANITDALAQASLNDKTDPTLERQYNLLANQITLLENEQKELQKENPTPPTNSYVGMLYNLVTWKK